MLSLWNYLRVRAHEAVLAGIKDALEDVELGDHGSHHLESSLALVQKLGDATPHPATSLSATKQKTPEMSSDMPKNRTKRQQIAAKKRSA